MNTAEWQNNEKRAQWKGMDKDDNKLFDFQGVVLEVGDCFVDCYIYLDDSQQWKIRIRIDKNLLPDDVHYGSPVILSFDKELQQIQIKPGIIIMTPEMVRENKEIDKIVDSF